MRYLINLPYLASTNNYAKYFPYPLNLMNVYETDDRVIDLNFIVHNPFNEKEQAHEFKPNPKKELIYEEINKVIHLLIEESEYNKIEILANTGDYAPDADKYEFFEYFITQLPLNIELTIMGPYALIFGSKAKKIRNDIKISSDKLNTYNVDIPLEMIKKYPKVGNKLRAQMRLSHGCPRKCAMCPVFLIHNKKYKFFDIDESIQKIIKYYKNGIRFINFIDDNIAVNLKRFKKFLYQLKNVKEINLKEMQFIDQEGFEVVNFHDEEFCQLLSELPFTDIKLGIENINEDFLKKIDKYYNKFSDIEKAMTNIKKYKLDVKIYLLVGLDETYEMALENLKFIAKYGLGVRCNIIRPYEGSELYKKGFERKMTNIEVRKIRSLAHTISWLNETYKNVNIFDKNALKQFKKEAKLTIKKDKNNIIIEGKIYRGFQTSKLVKVVKYLLNQKFNSYDIKLINQTDEKLVFKLDKITKF